jgi:hypothetical protein
VFLLATYEDEQHMFKGCGAGGVAYVMKSCPPEVLRERVNAFLRIARHRRELEMYQPYLAGRVMEQVLSLAERDKELKCLFAISSLFMEPSRSIPEWLETVVGLIPLGWHYPEMTRARIVFEGREFVSADFRDTAWKQFADIVIRGEKVGAVEVCLLEERPEAGEGPFLQEERNLIAEIARRLGLMIERKRAEA